MLARQRSLQSKGQAVEGGEGRALGCTACCSREGGAAMLWRFMSTAWKHFFSHGLVYLILTAPVSSKQPLLELSELRPLRVLNPMEFVGCWEAGPGVQGPDLTVEEARLPMCFYPVLSTASAEISHWLKALP